MHLTARRLNRATLERQLLLSRASLTVPATVRRIMAVQSQEPASAYIALWNRVDGFDPARLDVAFKRGSVVRGAIMRMTLHSVHAQDYPTFRDAVEPTMYATHLDGRFTPPGLSAEQARAIVESLLDFARRGRTADEVLAWLEPRVGELTPKTVWPILRQYVPWCRVPTGGPWAFGARPVFRSGRYRARLDLLHSDEALQSMVKRFLAAFGPATTADVAQFALVQQVRVKAALRELTEELVQFEGPSGEVLHDLVGAPLPCEDTLAPPRLMAMWDNALLAHKGRDRLVPPCYRRAIIRANGDLLPTVLVDGQVAGVWRSSDEGIEVTAFETWTRATWEAVEVEARNLGRLVSERGGEVYRRYDRWWSDLPSGKTHTFSP